KLSTSGSNVAMSCALCCSMLLYVELERQICASEPNECDPGAVNTVVEQLQRNVCRFCSLRRVCISWRCIQPKSECIRFVHSCCSLGLFFSSNALDSGCDLRLSIE